MKEELTKEELKKLGSSFNSKLGMNIFKKIDGIIYKLCTKCKKYKPMNGDNFSFRSNVKCGYNSYCKECEHKKELNRIRVIPFNEAGELYCLKCKLYHPISEFIPNDSTFKNRKYYSKYCSKCRKEIENNNKLKEQNSKVISVDVKTFFNNLANACKCRSYKNKNIKCTITGDYLVELYEKQNHKCALSGIEMTTIRKGGKCPNNASVDRIHPGEDYTRKNIRLVCNHVNMMRSNLSDEKLIEYCKAIIEYDNNIKKRK